MLCLCETGDKNDKLLCFKKNLADFYRANGAYDSELAHQLNQVTSLEDFDFVNCWSLTGFSSDGSAIGGSITANKNSEITTLVLTSNIILNRFFVNLSKNHITFQKIVKLPESTIHTRVFQDLL